MIVAARGNDMAERDNEEEFKKRRKENGMERKATAWTTSKIDGKY